MSVYYRAQTDAEGHFTFIRVPPGQYKLFRYLDNLPGTIIYSHRQDIEVKAGETIGLQLGGKGVRNHFHG